MATKFDSLTPEQQATVNDLGLQLRDNLGVMNKVKASGAIGYEEWDAFLKSFRPAWELFEKTFGISIDEATRNTIKAALSEHKS